MKTLQVRATVSLAIVCLLAASIGYSRAEQKENDPTGDIKPAQTDSPAAHPVTSTANDERQVTDRQDNNRQDNTTVRTRTDDARTSANREQRNDRESNLNRQLAACLLTKNKGEVELGKFASERAKDRTVK